MLFSEIGASRIHGHFGWKSGSAANGHRIRHHLKGARIPAGPSKRMLLHFLGCCASRPFASEGGWARRHERGSEVISSRERRLRGWSPQEKSRRAGFVDRRQALKGLGFSMALQGMLMVGDDGKKESRRSNSLTGPSLTENGDSGDLYPVRQG